MIRIKVVGLALVAVFAIAALSASAASAAGPIWYTCGKAAVKGTGHHTEKNCSDAAKETGGNYNLVAGIGKGKAAKDKGGAAVLHSVNPEAKVDIPVECASFKGGFSIAPPNKMLKAKTTFSKCKALGAPCENVKKETIATKTLAGSLGWINKAGKVVGSDLVNEETPGSYLAEFKCEALGEIRTHGSAIAQVVGNVGVINGASKTVFAPGPYIGEQHAGCVEEKCSINWTPIVNVPKFEGGPLDILLTEVKGGITGHPTEFYPPGGIPSGQEGTSENKGEKVGIYEEGSL